MTFRMRQQPTSTFRISKEVPPTPPPKAPETIPPPITLTKDKPVEEQAREQQPGLPRTPSELSPEQKAAYDKIVAEEEKALAAIQSSIDSQRETVSKAQSTVDSILPAGSPDEDKIRQTSEYQEAAGSLIDAQNLLRDYQNQYEALGRSYAEKRLATAGYTFASTGPTTTEIAKVHEQTAMLAKGGKEAFDYALKEGLIKDKDAIYIDQGKGKWAYTTPARQQETVNALVNAGVLKTEDLRGLDINTDLSAKLDASIARYNLEHVQNQLSTLASAGLITTADIDALGDLSDTAKVQAKLQPYVEKYNADVKEKQSIAERLDKSTYNLGDNKYNIAGALQSKDFTEKELTSIGFNESDVREAALPPVAVMPSVTTGPQQITSQEDLDRAWASIKKENKIPDEAKLISYDNATGEFNYELPGKEQPLYITNQEDLDKAWERVKKENSLPEGTKLLYFDNATGEFAYELPGKAPEKLTPVEQFKQLQTEGAVSPNAKLTGYNPKTGEISYQSPILFHDPIIISNGKEFSSRVEQYMQEHLGEIGAPRLPGETLFGKGVATLADLQNKAELVVSEQMRREGKQVKTPTFEAMKGITDSYLAKLSPAELKEYNDLKKARQDETHEYAKSILVSQVPIVRTTYAIGTKQPGLAVLGNVAADVLDVVTLGVLTKGLPKFKVPIRRIGNSAELVRVENAISEGVKASRKTIRDVAPPIVVKAFDKLQEAKIAYARNASEVASTSKALAKQVEVDKSLLERSPSYATHISADTELDAQLARVKAQTPILKRQLINAGNELETAQRTGGVNVIENNLKSAKSAIASNSRDIKSLSNQLAKQKELDKFISDKTPSRASIELQDRLDRAKAKVPSLQKQVIELSKNLEDYRKRGGAKGEILKLSKVYQTAEGVESTPPFQKILKAGVEETPRFRLGQRLVNDIDAIVADVHAEFPDTASLKDLVKNRESLKVKIAVAKQGKGMVSGISQTELEGLTRQLGSVEKRIGQIKQTDLARLISTRDYLNRMAEGNRRLITKATDKGLRQIGIARGNLLRQAIAENEARITKYFKDDIGTLLHGRVAGGEEPGGGIGTVRAPSSVKPLTEADKKLLERLTKEHEAWKKGVLTAQSVAKAERFIKKKELPKPPETAKAAVKEEPKTEKKAAKPEVEPIEVTLTKISRKATPKEQVETLTPVRSTTIAEILAKSRVNAKPKEFIRSGEVTKEAVSTKPGRVVKETPLVQPATVTTIETKPGAETQPSVKPKVKTITDTKAAERAKVKDVTKIGKAERERIKPAGEVLPLAETRTQVVTKTKVKTKTALKTKTKPARKIPAIAPHFKPRMTDAEKREAIKKAGGAFYWQQGQLHGKKVYHVGVVTEGRVIKTTVLGKPPEGAIRTEGKGQAKRTIRVTRGDAPKSPVRIEGGAIDVVVSPTKTAKRVAITFTRDPKYLTRTGRSRIATKSPFSSRKRGKIIETRIAGRMVLSRRSLRRRR